jgi:hypothetical protein
MLMCKQNFFDDYISKHWDSLVLAEEDGDIDDLPDQAKDEACLIWLTKFSSWHTDIYPASISDSVAKIATQMLFKDKVASRIVTNLFVAMAEDDESDDRDDLWWSHAGEMHLDTIVNARNFADEMREMIYEYLYEDMQDAITERVGFMIAEAKWSNYDEE